MSALCTKVAYATQAEARTALHAVRARRKARRRRGAEASAYRCPTCASWHLTSSP